MATKITSPIKGFTGRTVFGPTTVNFQDGIAEADELSDGSRAYLERRGYTIEDEDEDEDADEGPFDPAKHNQDEVIEYLEQADVDDDERARVLAAEGERDNGTRQKVAKWVEARDAAAKEAAEKAADEQQNGGEGQ